MKPSCTRPESIAVSPGIPCFPPRFRRSVGVAGLMVLAAATYAQDGPRLAPAYVNRFSLTLGATVAGNPTQMEWGPDGKLYVMTQGSGVIRYDYDKTTGAVTNPVTAATNLEGIGIAFHRNNMYVTTFDGSIVKMDDRNGDGVYGDTANGDLRVRIVTGLPTGDHAVDQLAVRGNTLYVGIGIRTINGRRGDWTMGSGSDSPNDRGFWGGGRGFSWGDSVYGGTIAYIRDLNTVRNVTGSANTWTNTTLTQQLIQEDDSPLRPQFAGATDKLLIHSSGARNPFGLALDKTGELYFTNNFNRTDTLGNGEAGFGLNGDQLGPDFSRSVHDQAFKAVLGGDYGYWSDNWRPKNPMLDRNRVGYRRVYSLTFDNLFNKGPFFLHNPAQPRGLGPHSSANGCGFYYADGLPRELEGNLFITRWNTGVTEMWTAADPVQNTLIYSDVVALDTRLGTVRRVAQNFNNPIDVLWDGGQRLLIADYSDNRLNPGGGGVIHALQVVRHRLDVSARLVRANNGVSARVQITNAGDFDEAGIMIRRVILANRRPITSLPVNVGSLAKGATSRELAFHFPITPNSGGMGYQLLVSGTYNGGGTFAQIIPVSLP